MPTAKAAVTQLRLRITELLAGERQSATAVLEDHEQRLRELPDFAKLNAEAQTQVLAKSSEARAAFATARFVTTIRDRLNRYRTQDYPAQLALVSRLAAPLVPAKPLEGSSPKPTPAGPNYVPVSSLRVKFDVPFIGSKEDLDRWLAALRAVAAEELAKGNRISL